MGDCDSSSSSARIAQDGMRYDVSMITAGWLASSVFRESQSSMARITNVRAKLLPKQGFLSSVYRIEIETDPAGDDNVAHGTEVVPPRSLIAKICLPKDHRFMPAIREEGLYDREMLFYNEVASRLQEKGGDLHVTPHVYFSSINPETREFLLLMEDMSLRGGYTINQMDGCEAQETLAVANRLALFHAFALREDSLVPHIKERLNTLIHTIPNGEEMTQRFQTNWSKFAAVVQFFCTRFDRSTDGFPSQVSSAFGKNLSRFLQLTATAATSPSSQSASADSKPSFWQSVPLSFQRMQDPAIATYSLAHGDMRLDNLIFVTPKDVVFVDWQSLIVGNVVYDLSWFLAQSPTCDVRASTELDAVRLYHETLCHHCPQLTYSLDQCLLDYRLGLLISLAHLVNTLASNWFPLLLQDNSDDETAGGERILKPATDNERTLNQFVIVALDRSVSAVLDNFGV